MQGIVGAGAELAVPASVCERVGHSRASAGDPAPSHALSLPEREVVAGDPVGEAQ